MSEYKDVFISYKSEEVSKASEMKKFLESNGVSCWMDEDQISGGTSFASEIADSIKNCSIVLFILSESAQQSDNIKNELGLAVNYKKYIIPYRIDSSELQGEFAYYFARINMYMENKGKLAEQKRLLSDIKKQLAKEKEKTNKKVGSLPAKNSSGEYVFESLDNLSDATNLFEDVKSSDRTVVSFFDSKTEPEPIAKKKQYEIKKKKNKIFNILSVAVPLLLMILAACLVVNAEKLKKYSDNLNQSYNTDLYKGLESTGNILNDGLVADGNDGYIYYQNHSDNWCIYKTDGVTNVKLNSDNSWCINVQDGYVYYANVDDNSSIYKMKTDGTDRQKLNKDDCGLVVVYGDYIYYRNSSAGNKIYKMKTDGTEREAVTNDAVSSVQISNDWIYYSKNDEYVYRIKHDGSLKEQLNTDKSSCINVYKDKVYYCNYSDNQKIYRMNLDGRENSVFCYDKASYINVYNDNVYYSNLNDNGYMYSISVDTIEKIKLNSDNSRYINIADGRIYYRIGTNSKKLYSVDIV